MTPKSYNQIDRAHSKAYSRDFWPAVVGYTVATALVAIVAGRLDLASASRWWYGLALLPIGPALWGVRAIRRHLGRIDEYQRDVHLEAMALGFGLAMIASLTLGFLATFGMDTNRWGPWIIFVAGMAGWAVHTTLRDAVR